ncbi:ATP-binding protein [Cocleimonas sp. KMM 6892]|uniref:ATP-binding protein n=1 Tax=unclassified Cocleimonas TaxID=2639732 RepID=UPI002DB76E9A|nr:MULTISPECIES: ATP-binding protein [unclassified Cocleimonas]MEB8432172.1 ATP-binding protein [Cocleimonas sp. KMM 6892]MEC4714742.1 ATP-binding protein [Cocleimonas sp. KMM 6895]MEC4744444.1 ATP-binding protein [Cocleimonas sp. KMM 6896]
MLKNFTRSDVVYRHTFVIILAFVLIIGSAVVLSYTYKQTNAMNERIAKLDAEQFATSVAKFRNFYSEKIVPIAKDHGLNVTHDYENANWSIPLPATFAKDFGEYISSDDKSYAVKLYSDLPFPWRSQEKLDTIEKATIEKIKENPDAPVISVESHDGNKYIRYARGDIMKESCVACHNSYPGSPKTDWKVGDVRGVLEVIRPINTAQFNSIGLLKESFLMMLAIILSMVGLIFFVLRKLTNSLNAAYEAYEKEEKTSQKLHASSVKMTAIVNSVEEVIIVIDEKGIITECNNSIVKVFGYSVKEIIGKNVSVLMTGDHHIHHDNYIEEYIGKGEGTVMGQNREFVAIRKNGEVFPIELFVNDARIGDTVFFTGSIRDITERIEIEKDKELTHKAALESAELKSEFLANMSHEIRTPMNGVIGMTELLLLSDLDEEQQELAHTVKDSADSLLTIINDILDFSKIEAGKLSIKKRHFKLLKMIEGSIDLLSKEANKKEVELAFFIDKNVPLEITGDAGRLRQILINLLNNALKFTEDGQVILYVSMNNDDTMCFSIIDSGIGIPEDSLATLFDSFSQVDGSSSREHGGTGLGLAICKQLVNLMKGEMGVESKLGVGSTFWFTIKLDENNEHPIKPLIDSNARVLMWSTSETLNRYYKEQLSQWGMSSTIVRNLNSINSELDNNTYNMLALDADNIFIDENNPESFFPILETLRQKSNALFVLYASHQQYQFLSTLKFEKNIVLFKKPIKHTAIKTLMDQFESRANKTTEQDSSPIKIDTLETTQEEVTNDEKTTVIEKDKYHILLAEDNLVNQKVAVKMLTNLGCKVTVSNNGQEALDKAREYYYDAIFMDCQMPELDGYEATKLIRTFPQSHMNYDIPVIAFTANAMKDDHKKCEQAGMDDYLSKPVSLDKLEKVIHKWIEKMAARQSRYLKQKLMKELL